MMPFPMRNGPIGTIYNGNLKNYKETFFMKKAYSEPILSVVEFDSEDVITTSAFGNVFEKQENEKETPWQDLWD